jgi:hypothetical protein
MRATASEFIFSLGGLSWLDSTKAEGIIYVFS